MSVSGLDTGNFSNINVAYGIGVGVDSDQGLDGQVLISGGKDEPNRWGAGGGEGHQKLTKGSNISMENTEGEEVNFYDGTEEVEISSADTESNNFSNGRGINLTGDGSTLTPYTFSTNNDNVTINNLGGIDTNANQVLKVPKKLTKGHTITFMNDAEPPAEVSTYDGSEAVTISSIDTTYTAHEPISISTDVISLDFDTTTLETSDNKLKVKRVPNKLTKGVNITFKNDADESVDDYDGSEAVTISSAITVYTATTPIKITDNDISLDFDTTTLEKSDNKLKVKRVPSSLTAGTGITFSGASVAYDGSAAIEISSSTGGKDGIFDSIKVVDKDDNDFVKIRFDPTYTDPTTRYYFTDGLQVGNNAGDTESRFRVNARGLISQKADTARPTGTVETNIFRNQISIRANNSDAGNDFNTLLHSSLGESIIPNITTGGAVSGTRQYTNRFNNNVSLIGNTDGYSGTYKQTPSHTLSPAHRSQRGAYLNNNLFFNTDDGVLEGFSATNRTECKNLDLTDGSNLLPANIGEDIFKGNITNAYKFRKFDTTSSQFDVINDELDITFTCPTGAENKCRAEFSYYADVSSGMTYFLAPIEGGTSQPQWCLDSMIRGAKYTVGGDFQGQHNEQFLFRGLVAGTTYTFNIGIFCITSSGHSITFKMGGGQAFNAGGGSYPSASDNLYPGMFLKLHIENGSNTNSIPTDFI